MVEMERRGGPTGRWTRQQVRVMHGGVSGQTKRKSDCGRDKVTDGVEEKAWDSSGNRATSSVDRRSSKGFARLGCGVAKGGDDGAIAVGSFLGKQVGLVQCGGRKMERKSDGYNERDFSGHKIADSGDCCVEDGCSVVMEVVDEEVSDTGEETSGTRASSCVARRTRSQMDKLMHGMKKSTASIPEDLIRINDSDNDGDARNEEEKDEAYIIKNGDDMDDSAVIRNREDKGNKDDSVLSLSVDDDEVKMRQWSIPVAKRTRQQIRLLCNEVFGKRRKLGAKFHRDSDLRPEIFDVCDDGAEDDSQIIKEARDAEEKTGDSLGSLAPSCAAHQLRSRVTDLMHTVSKPGDYNSENFNCISEEIREEEENNEDEEDVIIGGTDKEDSVDQGSREDKTNDDDSNEHMSDDGEGAKDSEVLPLICSSEEENDVPRNKCYMVDEFWNLCSEDEAISSSVEKGEKHETDAENNGREDCVQIIDDDGKDEDEDEDEDADDDEDDDRDGDDDEDDDRDGDDDAEWEEDDEESEEGDDDNCKDEYNDDNSVDDSVKEKRGEDEYSEDDLMKYKSVDGEDGGNSEELPLICSSEEENDVLRNVCYLADKSGNLYSEVEREAGNNSREDWVQILDDDSEDEDADVDDDEDDDEEWKEGNDDNSMDDSVEENSGEDQHSEDDFTKYRSVDGEEGRNSDKELLLSSSSDKENVSSMDPSANITRNRMPACVARRTRSCFKMTRSDIMKAGTFSNPCFLDSDDDDDDQKIALRDNLSTGESNKIRVNSASKVGVEWKQISEGKAEELDRSHDRKLIRHVDDTGKIQLADSASENGDECKQKSKGRDRKSVFPSKRKHIPRACDARAVLLEAIWSQRDTLHESLNIAVPKVKRITNWKFTFEEEDSQPTEKSEAEQEFDKLWMEFEFCLRSCEVESANTDMVENENLLQPILDSCRRGNHDAVLNEEIGFRCRHCFIILQEIRDVVAPFRKDPVEKYVKRDFGRVDDDDFFGRLPNEIKTNDLNQGLPSNHDGTVWDLIPGIKSTLYPHQQEGFEFIWKNIAGAVNLSEVRRLKESNDGSGCIISHAPGTGKSCLTIVFLQAYLRFFPDCRPVIIAPKSILLTWEEEFKKWNVDVPFHNLNNDELSGKEDADALGVLTRLNNGSPRKEILRIVKLYSWKCQSAVLGISYSLFEKLTLGRNTAEGELSEGNVLLKLPGILVLDEGHTPRNNDSLIWQALSNVRTEKRICLSGTPFQNNFQELFNTFCMARPRFATTTSHRKKGNGMRRRGHKSTVKANWANLTNSICENNVEELEKLKAMISPFVHVYKGNVLQDTLPGLSQRVVYLRPGSLQKSLLQTADAIVNVIERRHIASLISVHPSLLLQHSSAVITGLFPDIREELEGTQLTPRDGAKTKFLTEFLRLTDALKEKVLVFSDYIDPLMFLKDQLKSCFGWTEGEEILYMDGKLDVRQRQASISIFNEEDSNAKVLLASTRACCEGISLVGASRVVLLDAAWNPSVQRQAISRAYRIGQKRFVYVYYLITYATIEEDVYRQQVNKDRLSNMVFPSGKESDINGHPDSDNGPEDQILLEMLQHSTIADLIEKVV